MLISLKFQKKIHSKNNHNFLQTNQTTKKPSVYKFKIAPNEPLKIYRILFFVIFRFKTALLHFPLIFLIQVWAKNPPTDPFYRVFTL